VATSLSTVAGFSRRFAGEIRVAFNWHRFAREAWSIERVQVRLPDRLAAIEAPWCVDRGGQPCGEIPDMVDRLGGSADFIRQRAALYRELGIMRDELPAYGLRCGAILLDGVHRSTAALMANVPIELDLYVVVGPLDPDCLADLRI
jgi:hypothetical protein